MKLLKTIFFPVFMLLALAFEVLMKGQRLLFDTLLREDDGPRRGAKERRVSRKAIFLIIIVVIILLLLFPQMAKFNKTTLLKSGGALRLEDLPPPKVEEDAEAQARAQALALLSIEEQKALYDREQAKRAEKDAKRSVWETLKAIAGFAPPPPPPPSAGGDGSGQGEGGKEGGGGQGGGKDSAAADQVPGDNEGRMAKDGDVKKDEKGKASPPVIVNENAVKQAVSVEQLRSGDSFVHEDKGVFGVVVNNTDRSVKDVILAILFLDNSGRVIHQKKIYPLVVSGGVFGDQAAPLEPGKEKKFGTPSKGVPRSWSGQVKHRIIGYRFLDPGKES